MSIIKQNCYYNNYTSKNYNMQTENKIEPSNKEAITNAANGNHSINWVRNHPAKVTGIIGMFLIIIVYFWKDFEAKKQKKDLVQTASERLLENNQLMLKLVSKPLVWSIRSEMLRNNMEQVNILTKDLVKEKNFQAIHIIEPSGQILISTDKKLEGQSAIGTIDPSLLNSDSVLINKTADMLFLSAPIMGYDKKLGFVVITYKPEKFSIPGRMSENK